MSETTNDASAELLLNLHKQAKLRRQLNAAIKRHGLALYRPHEKQELFHRAAAHYRKRMVRAGNRFGKSQMGCAEDVAWLLGHRPWLKESDPFRTAGIPQRPVKLLTITTDWDIVDRIWTSERGEKPGKIWRYLPPGFVKSKRRNHSGAIDMIECVNGSLWCFDTVKAYKADPQSAESADWDAIHVDEPCPQDMFSAHARGLMDRKGSFWFTLTPLSEMWINDLFFPVDTGGAPRDDVWSVNGSTYDNPYLTPEAIAEFEALISDDEKQCRIHGTPLHLTGLIYKEFQWSKHVLSEVPCGWRSWIEPPANASIYVAIDPHPHTPHAVLFLAVDQLGNHIYFYDHFEHCKISALCEKVFETLRGRRPVLVQCDKLAWIRHPVTDDNMANEFHRCGLMVEEATKALAHGILRVQAQLKAEPQRVFFTPWCRRTLWEIQRYSWDQNKPDKPIDKDDHMMENLYRLELCDPVWIDPANSNIVVPDVVIPDAELDLEPVDFSLD